MRRNRGAVAADAAVAINASLCALLPEIGAGEDELRRICVAARVSIFDAIPQPPRLGARGGALTDPGGRIHHWRFTQTRWGSRECVAYDVRERCTLARANLKSACS